MLAYLDAGTGSLIATVVVGGTAAAGVAVRSARAKMTGALTRKRKVDVSEGRADATAPEAGATPTNG